MRIKRTKQIWIEDSVLYCILWLCKYVRTYGMSLRVTTPLKEFHSDG
jgi:hypothetical protein